MYQFRQFNRSTPGLLGIEFRMTNKIKTTANENAMANQIVLHTKKMITSLIEQGKQGHVCKVMKSSKARNLET